MDIIRKIKKETVNKKILCQEDERQTLLNINRNNIRKFMKQMCWRQ